MSTAVTSRELLDELVRCKIDFFCGVPDSIVGGLIKEIEERDIQYVPATCEDVAVGVAVGAYLGGRRPAVLMQNSGLGNAGDSYMTLAKLYRIPVLFIVSVPHVSETEASPERANNIQHLDWERLTLHMLEAIEFPYVLFKNDTYKKDIKSAVETMNKKEHPVALIMRKQ